MRLRYIVTARDENSLQMDLSHRRALSRKGGRALLFSIKGINGKSMQIRFSSPLSWNNAFLFLSSSSSPGKVSSTRWRTVPLSMAAPSLGNYPRALLEKEEISMKMRLSSSSSIIFDITHNIEKTDNTCTFLWHNIASGRRKDIIVSDSKLFPTFR